jgi:geranylgeranyl diphosphate synthase type II
MRIQARIEQALEAALARAESGTAPDRQGAQAPPRLVAAMRHAVFPGGARVRPRLCLAVADACGADDRAFAGAEAAASAIELLHCASLVHDDLPCFDDAATRRGAPSVHSAFGEPLAVLAGDGLIVLAFEVLAQAPAQRLPALLTLIAGAVGAPSGLVAGQAWESEPRAPLKRYHAAKTGALFVAATASGAIAAGADPTPWRAVGARLGEAYQIADDLLDAVGAEGAGKPLRQDSAHARPNAVASLGVKGAVRRLELVIAEAVRSVPDCPGADGLRDLVRAQASRLAPPSLVMAPA